jgi:hypothetical protein
MGLIPAVIAGAGAIVGAAVVKVIADDAREWTPWVTRRLLDIAVRRLPEGQRERYAEEWAAHLAEVPGVVGKIAVSLQFQIAAFGVRELDAKTRLDAWFDEHVAALGWIHTIVSEVLASTGASSVVGEADGESLVELDTVTRDALVDIRRRVAEVRARRPVLGITLVGVTFMGQEIFCMARREVARTATKARNWPTSVCGDLLRMLGRFDK